MKESYERKMNIGRVGVSLFLLSWFQLSVMGYSRLLKWDWWGGCIIILWNFHFIVIIASL